MCIDNATQRSLLNLLTHTHPHHACVCVEQHFALFTVLSLFLAISHGDYWYWLRKEFVIRAKSVCVCVCVFVWDECACEYRLRESYESAQGRTHTRTYAQYAMCVYQQKILAESRRERERVTAREQERESGTSSANLAQQLRRSRLNSNWTTDWRRAEWVCLCVRVECTVISHSRSCWRDVVFVRPAINCILSRLFLVAN